ncbi:hypothetical protein HP532_20370 [Pseudomonas sp. CrR25]|nr:hypothetical protein [Pseudomonas sp. CrR25]
MSRAAVSAVLQVGVVVADLDASLRQYRELLGLDGWQQAQVDTVRGLGRNFQLRGQGVQVKARIAWLQLGNLELELIQPQDEHSLYAEFLREQGPGVHHLLLAPAGDTDLSERLQARGIPLLAQGELQQSRFQLFDCRQALGLICEIAEGQPLSADCQPPSGHPL